MDNIIIITIIFVIIDAMISYRQFILNINLNFYVNT